MEFMSITNQSIIMIRNMIFFFFCHGTELLTLRIKMQSQGQVLWLRTSWCLSTLRSQPLSGWE